MCPWSCRGSPTEEKRSSLFCKKKIGRNRRVEWSAVRIRLGILMLSSKMYVYMALQRTQIRNIFWAFIILTHPSVLQEFAFIIYTRGGGSWYFRPRSRRELANFTPIAGMGHLISEPKFKIPILISPLDVCERLEPLPNSPPPPAVAVHTILDIF